MAESSDEFNTGPSQWEDPEPAPRATRLGRERALTRREVPVGFIGLPNSGKTSFIHAIRNTSIQQTRCLGRWGFGGVGSMSGNAVEDPESGYQGATAPNFFRIAPFCDVRRAWLRFGPVRTGRIRTLLMPEVAGEIVDRIAKGPDFLATTPMVEQQVARDYQQFIAASEGILCFISLDGSHTSTSATKRIDPESSLMSQLVAVRRVLESCDEERAKLGHARHYAVSVIIAKADLLRDQPQIDLVRLPRSRSSVATLAGAQGDQILENELRRQDSSDAWVQFSVWNLMRFPRAQGNLDLQEAIAADFLKCHAPRTAAEMAALQGDEISSRNVRLFLSAPYGRSFSSGGRRRFPEPHEIDHVMLFEPLISVLETSWLLRAGDRIRRRTSLLAAAALLVLALGPLLTSAAEQWVSSGLKKYQQPSPTNDVNWDDLGWRTECLRWTPQALLLERVPLMRAWFPETTQQLADLQRKVAEAMENKDPNRADVAIQICRRWASKVAPNSTGDLPLSKRQAEDLRNFLIAGRGELDLVLDFGTLTEFRDQLKRGGSGIGPIAKKECITRFEDLRERKKKDLPAAESRIMGEIFNMLRVHEQGDLSNEDRHLVTQVRAKCRAFKVPSDLKNWPNPDVQKWADQLIYDLAHEALLAWVSTQIEILNREARNLAEDADTSVTVEKYQQFLEGLNAIPEWVWTGDWADEKTPKSKVVEQLQLLARGQRMIASLTSEQIKNDKGWEEDLKVVVKKLHDRMDRMPVTQLFARELILEKIVQNLKRKLTGVAIQHCPPELIKQLRDVNQEFKTEANMLEQNEAFSNFGPEATWDKVIDQLECLKPSQLFHAIKVLMDNKKFEFSNKLQDLANNLAEVRPGWTERLKACLSKNEQAKELFIKRVLPDCLTKSWALQQGGKGEEAQRWMRLGMELSSAKSPGAWCRVAHGDNQALSAICKIFKQATREDDLRKQEATIKHAGEWLAILERFYPKAGDPSTDPKTIRLAIDKHREWIREFDMCKVAGAGPGQPSVWISRLECSPDTPRVQELEWQQEARAPAAAVNKDLQTAFKQIQGVLKDLGGPRLPTLDELELANSHRPANANLQPLIKKMYLHPKDFRRPEDLRDGDVTSDGVVGLSLGVTEVCTKNTGAGVIPEAFGEKNQFSQYFGFHMALDELPFLGHPCP